METIIGAVIAATAAVVVVRLTRRGERTAWLRQERLAAYSDLLSHLLRSDHARVIASGATAEDSEEDASATMLTAEHELPHAEDELQRTMHKLQQGENKLQQGEDKLKFQTHMLELFARIWILGPPDMVHAAVDLIAAHRDEGIPPERTRSALNDAEQQFILTAIYT